MPMQEFSYPDQHVTPAMDYITDTRWIRWVPKDQGTELLRMGVVGLEDGVVVVQLRMDDITAALESCDVISAAA